MEVRIKQGKRGNWRWLIYSPDGKFKGVSHIKGFETAEQAYEDAIHVFKSAVTIVDENEARYHAGERDFSG